MGGTNRTLPGAAPAAAGPLATVGPAPPVLDPGGNMASAAAAAATVRARMTGSGRASTILGATPASAPPSFNLSPRPGSWRPY